MNVGVIGVGSLGRHHARVYSSLTGCKLIGVSDSDERRGNEVAQEFGSQHFRDYRRLLDDADAVSVCVPTEAHHSIAKDVLSQGIHCLLEKPIAADLAQARELVDLAKERELVFQIGHIERFNPAIVSVRDVVRDPLFIESHRLAPYTPRGTDVAVILDLMIHDIDIVLHFTAAEIVGMQAVGVPVLSDQEDIANVRMEMSTGCIVNLTASRVSREKLRKIRFFQPDKYISVDCLRKDVEIYERVSGEDGLSIRKTDVQTTTDEPLVLELQSFVDCVEQKRSPLVTGEDGMRALAVALEIQEQVREKRREIAQKARRLSL